jgi:hypothetical protein
MKLNKILAAFISIISLVACNNEEQSSKTETMPDTSVKVVTNNLDSNAISFEKKLSLQGISYDVVVKGKGSIQQLRIITTGLTSSVDTADMEIDPAINAEVEDLDHDGFPELLVYTQSAGSGSYGKVVGFSPNKGKSISMIYFPEIDMESPAAKGYQGHDEFAIVESNLLRRFKTYESGDANAKPTGKMRQITYTLQNGEASKKFVMGKVIEIPIK